jgi:cytoskeletal protein CcmA (bactofilin family)
MAKYKLTKNSIRVNLYKRNGKGIPLYQIQALKDIPGICKKRDLGGWIQSKKNLDQTGTCWVADNAQVYDEAIVYEDAQIYGDAKVHGSAKVSGKARVFDKAKVHGGMIYENAQVYGNASVRGIISGKAKVYSYATVYNGEITDNAQVYGQVKVYSKVYGNAQVYGKADIIVPINFNCNFNPWKMVQEILAINENLPRLIGIHPNLDKIIEFKLKN